MREGETPTVLPPAGGVPSAGLITMRQLMNPHLWAAGGVLAAELGETAFLLWYWVVAAATPWMALRESFDRQPRTLQCSMLLKRLNSILRTGRREST